MKQVKHTQSWQRVRRAWTRKPQTQVVSNRKKYDRKRDKRVGRYEAI